MSMEWESVDKAACSGLERIREGFMKKDRIMIRKFIIPGMGDCVPIPGSHRSGDVEERKIL